MIGRGERSRQIFCVGGLCGDWWTHIAGQDPEMPSGMTSRVHVDAQEVWQRYVEALGVHVGLLVTQLNHTHQG